VYRTDIYGVAARVAGAEKILFGSDYPLICPKRYFTEMNQSGLPDRDIKSISVENAARLFGL